MSQIICRDVSLGYDGQTVCEHVSFAVEAGDCLCIVGDNGSGKSTLMRALLNLKSPQTGEILFGDGTRQKDIGYLPQQNDSQKDFPASVLEVVLSGCVMREDFRIFPGKKSREVAEDSLRAMGLLDLKRRPFRTLSGGQQQRVLLARAFCAAKKLLVLDEPVTGLDPLVSAELYSIIEEKNKKEGLTVISVSHAPERACHSASKILHLGGGGAAFFGDVDGYLESEIGKKYLCADDHHHHSGERRKVQ